MAYLRYVLGFKQTFFGPTWFIETLIFFALVYTLIQLLTRHRQVGARNWTFPNGKVLFVTAIVFGLIAFAVRLKFPTGTGPLQLQLGYFPLYVLMMVMGVVAYRNHWLDQIPVGLTRIWKWIATLSIPVFVAMLSLT